MDVLGIRRWIRRVIRRTTKPIPIDRAEYWKQKLSLVYMLLGWNAFGLTLYYIFTGRGDWAHYYGLKTDEEKNKRPGEYYAEMLGMKNVRIITVDGFKKVGEYEYKGEDTEEDKKKIIHKATDV